MAIILSLYFFYPKLKPLSNSLESGWNGQKYQEHTKNKTRRQRKVLLCIIIQQFFSITIAKLPKQTLIIFPLLNNDSHSTTWGRRINDRVLEQFIYIELASAKLHTLGIDIFWEVLFMTDHTDPALKECKNNNNIM